MSLRIVNTQLTTVGNGTILASGIIGQTVTRSGPAGAYTDTTDTAANIIAAMRGLRNSGSVADPINWYMQYINATGQAATLAAGTDVTLASQAPTPAAGVFTVPANQVATILVSAVPSAGLVTLTIMFRNTIATV